MADGKADRKKKSRSTTATASVSRAAKRAAKEAAKKADDEAAAVANIAAMPALDRRLAERLHAIVHASAPLLDARLWYGMPAYAKDGTIVCFFQSAQRFKTRYATVGFMHAANLDDGAMWPTAFALTELNAAVEERISALVKKAVR